MSLNNGKTITIDPLSPQQERAVFLLVSGKSQTETAEAVGVAVETVNRWLNGRDHPQFVAAYNAARAQAYAEAEAQLSQLYTKAASTLVELMDSEDEATRVKIALAVLKHGPPEIGETDPAILARLWAAEDREAATDLRRREMLAAF